MAPISGIFSGFWAATLLISQHLGQAAGGILNEQPAGFANNLGHSRATGPKPFYAIAHRVLSDSGIRDAVAHGANALEIDMMAWRDRWYTDHDGNLKNRGPPAENIFKSVAAQRLAGSNIIFVWLDLKNADYCNETYPSCNIEALREMTRAHLQPAGVRVLFGFYNDRTRAHKVIRDGLNYNEAIDIDNRADNAKKYFDQSGPADIRKRVMSTGYYKPDIRFGNCSDVGICWQLRRGVDLKSFGQVYGWTISDTQQEQADQMMHGGVDGLIYGHAEQDYNDTAPVRNSFAIITNWIAKNSGQRYLATSADKPW